MKFGLKNIIKKWTDEVKKEAQDAAIEILEGLGERVSEKYDSSEPDQPAEATPPAPATIPGEPQYKACELKDAKVIRFNNCQEQLTPIGYQVLPCFCFFHLADQRKCKEHGVFDATFNCTATGFREINT